MQKQKNRFRTVSAVYVPALSAVLTVCSFLCFLSVFDLPCPYVLITALCALMPAAAFFLLYGGTRKYFRMFLPIFLAVYFAAAYGAVWKGCLIVANSVIAKINDWNHYGILSYDTGSVSGTAFYAALALVPAIMIFACLIVVSVRNRLYVPVILLTLPFVFAGFYFHASVALPAAVVTMIAWAVLLSGSPAEKPVSPRAALWVCAAAVFFSVFTYFVLPYRSYTPSQKISELKSGILSGIENLRYGYGAQNVSMDVLPEGNLKNAESLSYTGETVLRVTMQKPCAVYLKGYVGSVYGGNRWNSLPATAYGGSFTGLFEWLSKSGFFPQSQIASLCGMASQTESFGITVENIALKSKTVYAPYEAVSAGGLSPQNVGYRNDAGIFSLGLLGSRSCSFRMYAPLSADYATADLNQWVKDRISGAEYARYLKEEAAYRAFVYKYDLAVPAGTEKTLTQYFGKTTLDSLKKKDVQTVIAFLRSYYQQKLSYSAEIDPLPAGSDFIADFLETGRGYDVHFATLSVMVLRSVGIPARYVEGYYLPQSAVSMYSQTENAVLDVKDSFAHAWAEIYLDGVGWVPAELTPGYYAAAKDSSRNTGTDESISNKNKNFYSDQESALSSSRAGARSKTAKGAGLGWIGMVSAAVLLALAIFAGAAVIARRTKRKKDFSQSDKSKAALKMYAYAVRLLRFDGIKIGCRSAFETSDEISGKYDRLTGKSYRDFLSLVYKARFGRAGPDGRESAFLQSYAASLARQIYLRQGFGRKLLLRISGLV